MSRVGKKIIQIPSGVEVNIDDTAIVVKGPKGSLLQARHPHVTVAMQGDTISCAVSDPRDVSQRALWGLFGALMRNMIVGVTQGYSRGLEVRGVGYKCKVEGKKLILDVGYSHEVLFVIPEDVAIACDKNVITVSGIDKQKVGFVASQIRKIRAPEPYKGKGIRYVDEIVPLKAGKAAKTAAK